jgi:hypothetical protein
VGELESVPSDSGTVLGSVLINPSMLTQWLYLLAQNEVDAVCKKKYPKEMKALVILQNSII